MKKIFFKLNICLLVLCIFISTTPTFASQSAKLLFYEDFEGFNTSECVFKNGNISYPGGVTLKPTTAAYGNGGETPVVVENSAYGNGTKSARFYNDAFYSMTLDFGKTYDFNNPTTEDLKFDIQFWKEYNKNAARSRLIFYNEHDEKVLDMIINSGIALYNSDMDKADYTYVGSNNDARDVSRNNDLSFVFNADESKLMFYRNGTLLHTSTFAKSVKKVVICRSQTNGAATWVDNIKLSSGDFHSEGNDDRIIASNPYVYSDRDTKPITVVTEDTERVTAYIDVESTAAADDNVKNLIMLITHFDSSGTELKGVELSRNEIKDTFLHKLSTSYNCSNITEGDYFKVLLLDMENLAPVISNPLKLYVVKADITDPTNPANITLPSDFAEFNFDIRKNGVRNYIHTATPENQLDGQAVEVFISDGSLQEGLGLTRNESITYDKFASNCTAGLYDSMFINDERKFILNITDSIYTSTVNIQPTVINADIVIRGASDNNLTWVGNFARQNNSAEIEEQWNDSDSNGSYKTVMKNAWQVAYPINLNNLDSYGIPKNCYTRVYSESDCAAKPGSFYQAVTDGVSSEDAATFDKSVFVNPFPGERAEDIALVRYETDSNCNFRLNSFMGQHKVIFDNIGFVSYASKLVPYSDNDDAALMFFGCKFYRGSHNGALSVESHTRQTSYYYRTFVFDCVAAYGFYDGFNYHGKNVKNSLAVEINSISYGNGSNYVPYWKNNSGSALSKTGRHSNNGSTAHFGMRMLRVGGKYWDCEGPVVGDVSTYSISIGCESGNILSTTNGHKVGFYAYNEVNDDNTEKYPARPKYFIDCYAYGNNMEYGFYAGTGNTQVYMFDCLSASNVTNHTGISDKEPVGSIHNIPDIGSISTTTWYK